MASTANHTLIDKDESAKEKINEWQTSMFDALNEIYPDLKAWDESNKEHLTLEIEETELAALTLLCAYTEEKKPLITQVKSMWDEDKVYQKAIANQKSKFKQLYRSVDCFIPYDFDFNFEFVDINEDEMLFGSVLELKKELDYLAMRAFEQQPVDSKNQVAKMAHHAYSQLSKLANFAIEHHLPLWVN